MSDVEGLARLQRRIDALPQKMKAEMKLALDRGADEVVELAKRFAADRKPDDADDLRSSIRKRPGKHELQVIVEATSPHAMHLEFGTRKMPAQPFLIPAFRTLRQRVLGRIKRAISKGAKEAMKG